MKCGVDVAPLRAEPDDRAEQVTQVVSGEPLRVEERRGEWARVVTAYGYPGWIRADALATGDGSFPPPESGSPVDLARRYVGAPYQWGGMTERGIDCSGLVHMAYRHAGRLVPRDAWQQLEAGEPVAEPQPGDLVLYADPGKPADHVAFWISGGRILHATARDDLGVVEEDEPDALAERRIATVRL